MTCTVSLKSRMGTSDGDGVAEVTTSVQSVDISETSIPPPTPPPPISLVASCAGLCNQLRVLFSYREVGRRSCRHLYLSWRRAQECPARFDDLFEPIEGATVLCGDLTELPQPYRADRLPTILAWTSACHPWVVGTPTETAMYADLKPLLPLRQSVAKLLEACGKRFVAIHVRRTDHKFNEQTSYASFNAFLEKHGDLPIFLATDNATTQQCFKDRFGDRLCALDEIAVPSDKDRAKHEFRHTPVSRAVAEMFVCAEATIFKGSYYSSFSDTIMHLRRVRGAVHEQDEHDTRLPTWHPASPYDVSMILEALPNGRTRTSDPPGARPKPTFAFRASAFDPMADPMTVPWGSRN